MSTIERALEKQRQLEEQRRQEEAAQGNAPSPSGHQPPADQVAAPTAPPQPATTEQAQTTSAEQTGSSTASGHAPLVIDLALLERQGMVTPSENFSQIKEEYRYIKRPLLNNAFGVNAQQRKNPNLIMVSSSFPGEGKTFTAINLAISMVLEQDRTVLLVDADVINPHVSQRLGIRESHPGLMDYLDGKVEIQDIILSTNIPKLKMITSGSRYHHSNEMLASERMKKLMDDLSSRYADRIVIFDTSPLLGASETNVLAQMTGQAVIVVEEEKTTHHQVERALSLLHPDMAVGLVLNKSKTGRKDYYGYYYAAQ